MLVEWVVFEELVLYGFEYMSHQLLQFESKGADIDGGGDLFVEVFYEILN